jgi:hypothetical protein
VEGVVRSTWLSRISLELEHKQKYVVLYPAPVLEIRSVQSFVLKLERNVLGIDGKIAIVN